MKAPLLRAVPLAFFISIIASPASAQRLVDDWLVRTSATPDALVGGPTAVFRNPAVLSPSRRAEAMLMDLRGPDVSSITGMAVAGSYRLDSRTSVAVGFEHVGVGNIEVTDDAPAEGNTLVIGQDLFAIGAAHALDRLKVGASAQYLRSSEVLNEPAAVRLGVGLAYSVAALPLTVAATAQSEDSNTLWSGGARFTPGLGLQDWNVGMAYGASGASERDGVSHRFSAGATWRSLITLEGGAAIEPGSDGSEMTAIGSIGVRVTRYELGVVRESLANGFGAVHTFRIGIVF